MILTYYYYRGTDLDVIRHYLDGFLWWQLSRKERRVRITLKPSDG